MWVTVLMFKTLNRSLFTFLILILPVFFFTSFTNVYDFPKTILLAIVACISLIVFVSEIISKGKSDFKVSSVDLPLLILVVSALISGIFVSQSKAEVFFFQGSATALSSIFLIY